MCVHQLFYDQMTEYSTHTWCALTGVDFSVVCNAVRVHDCLVTSGELVGLEISGRSIRGRHPVQDGGNCGATPLLREGVWCVSV